MIRSRSTCPQGSRSPPAEVCESPFANNVACALISMMARSTTRSNRRPDTLMQDRICQIDENLLQRTAGPYTGKHHFRPALYVHS
jgi:hypothetical protein